MSKDKIPFKNSSLNISLWPLIWGIVTVGFGIILLELRAIIPSFIIILIGISLILYWIYLTKGKNPSSPSGEKEKRCLCAICDHQLAKECLEQKCMCCLISKNNRIVGHTNNPLQ